MGRRKIEIQPITHERNRSVTFLKRKNGLFKKAYELGVLCSVDVAVIIFEERPGHELKLHQYSSCDVRDIIQRQLRHQGDKDIKGPGDFGNGAKFDDNGDGDDDINVDDDDDEHMPPPSTRSSKRKAGKLSLSSDRASNDDEYLPPGHRNNNPQPRLPPAPMPSMRSSGSSGRFDDGPSGSLLPISNDRVSSLRDSYNPHPHASQRVGGHKRPRSSLDSMDPGRRSRSPQDGLISTRGGGSDLYLPGSNTRGGYSGGPGGGGGPGGYNPHYTPMFPVHSQTSPPPPSFIPVQQQPLPSFSASNVREAYSGEPSSRARFDGPYDYPGVLPPGVRGGGPNDAAYGGSGGGGPPQHHMPHERGDMFAAFLEADERSRQQAVQRGGLQGGRGGGGGGGGLEWPTHDAAAMGRERMMEGHSGHNIAPPTHDSWFDLFSNANPSNPNNGGPPPPDSLIIAPPSHHAPPPQSHHTRLSSSSRSSGAGQHPQPQQQQQQQQWDRALVPNSTAGPSSRDDLATIFGAENVPPAPASNPAPSQSHSNSSSTTNDAGRQGRNASRDRGANGNGNAPTVVEIPAAPQAPTVQRALANAKQSAGGDVLMRSPERPSGAAGGGGSGGEVGPKSGSETSAADAEMNDAGNDNDGDGDADADGDGEGDGEGDGDASGNATKQSAASEK